jgi:hypothetical protein
MITKNKKRVPTFVPRAPGFIHCKGCRIESDYDEWPGDELRSRVATYVLTYRFNELLEIERAACTKQLEGFELSNDMRERMDRIVNTYGHEL